MPETVNAVAYGRFNSEPLFEIPLSIKPLSDKGFTRWSIHVRLDIPSIDNDPSSLLDKLFYPLEKVRMIAFDPPVNPHFASRELEIRIFVHKFRCGGTGGDGLRNAFKPAPQPHRIEMGISDKDHLLFHVLQLRFC